MDILTFILSLDAAKKYAGDLNLAFAAALSDLGIKVDGLTGRGGYLDAHDFGTATPTQQQLTDYALEQIGIEDPLQIWNGTHVKNLYVDPDTIDDDHPNGIQDSHIWALTNTPDTQPPIFKWVDDGPEGMGAATNRRYGAVIGVEDPGDGSRDGMVTVHPGGGMETLGFAALKTSNSGKLDIQQGQANAGKVLVIDDEGNAAPGVSGKVGRPDLWPDKEEVDLGEGLYGVSFKGVLPDWSNTGNLNFYTGFTIPGWSAGTSRIISFGGSFQKGMDVTWGVAGYNHWASTGYANIGAGVNGAGGVYVNGVFGSACAYNASMAGYSVWMTYRK